MVDALVVDTEGLDAEVVEAFLGVSSPTLLFFEAHIAKRQASAANYSSGFTPAPLELRPASRIAHSSSGSRNVLRRLCIA